MSEPQSTTVYRDIPDFPGYRVGDDGSVWSRWGHGRHVGKRPPADCWHQLVGVRNPRCAHLAVILSSGTRKRRAYIHRLVLEAFVGPCPPGMECRHVNGDPRDNRLVNLCWGTRTENCADTVRHGRTPSGERHHAARLTAEQVRGIRSRYAAGGVTMQHLANEHGLGLVTIFQIIRRRTWRHIN